MDNRHEIECMAYEIYLKGGCMPGRELDNWLEAERIVCSRLVPEQPLDTKKAAKPSAVKRRVVVKESKPESLRKGTDKTAPKSKSAKQSSVRKEASL
ncbi:MAG TPA: DUF2934 domain-containing protein [Dissulfurispiraceae bacterium]|nr:DUF2934 domain-containing protein [Dissulfurispiraceae bacterium]